MRKVGWLCLFVTAALLGGCASSPTPVATPAPTAAPTPVEETPVVQTAWQYDSTILSYNGEAVELTDGACEKAFTAKDGAQVTTSLSCPDDWTKVSFTYGRTQTSGDLRAEFHFTLRCDPLGKSLKSGKVIQSYLDRTIDAYSVPDESLRKNSEDATMSLIRAYFKTADGAVHYLEKENGPQTQFYLTKPSGKTDIVIADGNISTSGGYIDGPVPQPTTIDADEELSFVVEYELEGALWSAEYVYVKQ